MVVSTDVGIYNLDTFLGYPEILTYKYLSAKRRRHGMGNMQFHGRAPTYRTALQLMALHLTHPHHHEGQARSYDPRQTEGQHSITSQGSPTQWRRPPEFFLSGDSTQQSTPHSSPIANGQSQCQSPNHPAHSQSHSAPHE